MPDAVADRDTDALRPEVEAERAHALRRGRPRRASAAMRRASSMPAGSLAAGRRHVALAAATAADGLGGVLDEARRLDAGRRLHRGDEADAAGRRDAAEHDDVDAGLVAHGERQVAEVAGARARRRAATTTPSTAAAASSPARPVASLARSALSSSPRARSSSSLRWTPPTRSSPVVPTQLGGLGEHPLVALQERDAGLAGDGLDAAQVRADRALADDLDRADVAGRADVRAAAQLDRRAGLEHAHDVAVLVAEEGDRAERLGLRLAWSRTTRTAVLASVARVGDALDLARSARP